MHKLLLTAVGAALAITSPAAAQSAQERLDGRYDYALAAGYKALMLCSAIANAEANGTTRTPESVHEWELRGIQAPLDDIVRELPYEIVREGRNSAGVIDHVTVTWADDADPRIARHYPGRGCVGLPIGMDLAGAPERKSLDDQPVPIAFAVPAPPPSNTRSILRAAFGAGYGEGHRTTAIIVRKDGRPIDWETAPGFTLFTPQRTWSVAKSIAATVVGAAVHRDGVQVSDTARLGGENSIDPRRAITIDHALRMASGRYSDTAGNRTDPLYWGGTTVDERAQNWPLINEPGTVFRYANNDTLAAVQAIEMTFLDHPPSQLLRSLGMNDTVAETDWQGNYVLSSQVWSTADDLARLGQLYLDNGVLPDGTRILPENWRDYVSDPSGPQPQGRQWGYGAGWWTFRRPEGNAFEGIPDDAFAARGNRGQYVVVVPSRNVVIVRRGEDMVGTRFDIAAFTRDVLAALEQ
ncbi:MAG: serine hydrolase domain-containing protein [Erythrobacter sp.]